MSTITISGKSFESYVARADADTYLIARIGSDAWANASTTDRDKALVSATRWAERYMSTQLSSSSVPDPAVDPADQLVQDATTEMAFVLITDNEAQDKANTGSNTKSVKAGSAQVSFFRVIEGSALPFAAQQLLIQFIGPLASANTVGNLDSGTDGESTFCDIDQWGRTRGFP